MNADGEPIVRLEEAMSDNRKKALVTGASSGIGRAAAERFARDGYDVCITARREQRLTTLLADLAAGDHLACPGDYSDPDAVEAVGGAIRERWGRLDVLVNCAGVFLPADPIDSPLDEWRKPFDVMINGAVLVTRLAAALMPSGGRIIHVTSIHGRTAEAKTSAYSMAKAALNQYCRALAVDLAPRGILANAIAPGFIDTEMSVLPDGTHELESDWFRQNYVDGHHLPLKRPGRPEEVAGVAAIPAGPDATYGTGQVITADGGRTITF